MKYCLKHTIRSCIGSDNMTRSVTIYRGKTDGEGRVVFWSEFGVCADVFKNSAREGRRHRAARRRRPAPMKTTDLRYYIRVSEKTALTE